MFMRNDTLELYIIRIPGHGFSSSWAEEDTYNLQYEVGTMRLAHEHAAVPIPTVRTYSTTCDNAFDHPFILMDRAEGGPAC